MKKILILILLSLAACDCVTTSTSRNTPNPNLPEPTPLNVDVNVQPLDFELFEAIDINGDGAVTKKEAETFQKTAKAIKKEVKEDVQESVGNQTPTVKVNWVGPIVVMSILIVLVLILVVFFDIFGAKKSSPKENDGVLHNK